MMTTMKKIGFLICLLPLAACVVQDDDDNDTGADTEDSDSNASNSSPTSTPMTSGETDSQTSGMTEPDTTGETEEGSGSSSGGGGLGQCNTVCETYEDCCEAQGVPAENCNNTMLGGYECEDSECFVLLCADDMECQDLLANEAAVCNTTSGACIIGCETIDDCEMIAMGVYDACDPDLGCIVEAEPFDCNEMDCVAPFVCDTESGACVECLSDDDCAASDYGPYCDTEINLCACMGDDDCAFELDVCGQ